MLSRIIFAGASAAILFGQQPAAPPKPPPMKVLVAGENPGIRYLDKEGGKAITNVSFWRVHWSPVGPGTVCFITVTDSGAANMKVAIYDDERVLEYVSKELMTLLQPAFNDPPFTPLRGTITQTKDGLRQQKETCKSDRYTVDLIWKGLETANFVEFKPGGNGIGTFTMIPAQSGEILINGKQAPGKWYATGGGFGTGAFLAVNETWRR